MATRKREPVPILRVRKGATLREIYAAAKRKFSAADLQKYTEIEDMVPAEQLLPELEAIYREEMHKVKLKRKRNANARNGKRK